MISIEVKVSKQFSLIKAEKGQYLKLFKSLLNYESPLECRLQGSKCGSSMERLRLGILISWSSPCRTALGLAPGKWRLWILMTKGLRDAFSWYPEMKRNVAPASAAEEDTSKWPAGAHHFACLGFCNSLPLSADDYPRSLDFLPQTNSFSLKSLQWTSEGQSPS